VITFNDNSHLASGPYHIVHQLLAAEPDRFNTKLLHAINVQNRVKASASPRLGLGLD
jgi:hypothetical protein